MGLLVRQKARVAGREGSGMHTEDKNVEAVVMRAGSGIERSLRSTTFLRVPRTHPGLYALFEFGHDPVREFLYGPRGSVVTDLADFQLMLTTET